MDVPFISSGALNSAHYTLVRNVELSQTPQEADQFLLAQVGSVRHKLSRSGLSSKQCKECLILLLYCSITAFDLTAADLDFALPHAVNLVEAGASIQERRIGYLFCIAVMPYDHEFRLMLVNTIRKDLESPDVARISLALEYLIQCPTEDVIPAIQSRLHDLVSHNSPHVRRRTLFAVRALATHDPSMLRWMSQEISKRIRDSDSMVVEAAAATCIVLSKSGLLSAELTADIQRAVLHLSQSATNSRTARQVTQKFLRLYRIIPPSPELIEGVLALTRRISFQPKLHALLYDCFAVLRHIPTEGLLAGASTFIVTHIRHLLPSADPNEQYLFLSCLECIDPKLWAGTTPEIPAVLEAWEAERIMQFLDSKDAAIRIKTLRILFNIDSGIVSAYLEQKLQDPSAVSNDEEAVTLVELIEVISGEDGEQYARYVKDLFSAAADDQGRRRVLDRAVEKVLTYVRDKEDDFGSNVATTLLALMLNSEELFGATFMVVVTALACEYIGRAAVPPLQVLQVFSGRLRLYPVSIQEVTILAMLRLAAECESVPADVVSAITTLSDVSGRHIQRRCAQFLDFTRKPDVLHEIVSSSKSRSLPDFLAALESHQLHPPQPSQPMPSSPGASKASLSRSKLRYAAYELPPPAKRARSSTRTPSSRHSTPSLGHTDDTRPGSALSGGSRRSDDLARTVTAGDLALVAGSPELRSLSMAPERPRGRLSSPRHSESVDLLGSKVDLISLDSPFIAEPPTVYEELEELNHDFESSWNGLERFNARGWCDVSVDTVVRRLQGLQYSIAVLPSDQAPFEGELKILLSSGPAEARGRAALRLRESGDEDGCLWRLRCDRETILTNVKRVLAD